MKQLLLLLSTSLLAFSLTNAQNVATPVQVNPNVQINPPDNNTGNLPGNTLGNLPPTNVGNPQVNTDNQPIQIQVQNKPMNQQKQYIPNENDNSLAQNISFPSTNKNYTQATYSSSSTVSYSGTAKKHSSLHLKFNLNKNKRFTKFFDKKIFHARTWKKIFHGKKHKFRVCRTFSRR
ncbi:MAG: hypothetical protein V2A54_13615 [Bacteroidota bacterium]